MYGRRREVNQEESSRLSTVGQDSRLESERNWHLLGSKQFYFITVLVIEFFFILFIGEETEIEK